MNYNTFNIFPTTIYVGKLDNHEEYKSEFYKVYPKFDYEEDGEDINTVSENSGNPLIHLEESLNPLFEEIVIHVKKYMHEVLLLKDMFDVVITKTWLSRARQAKDQIQWHIHSTSHISFAYYLNMPKNSHSIKFQNQHQPNSLFLGMNDADYPSHKRMFVESYNEVNSQTFFIVPEEGNVVLFPSKTIHCTDAMSDVFTGERLAIVGDITLILREEHLSYSMGYINEKYWKKFT